MANMDRVAKREWIAGSTRLRGYVRDEGQQPFRPEALLWMAPDGQLLGHALFRPEQAAAELAASFEETVRAAGGATEAPARVRVASRELAAILEREIGEAAEVVCAPTPELDAALAGLAAHLERNATKVQRTYLEDGITADAMAAFFGAAATMYRAKPWKVVPDDASVLSVSIEALGVRRAAVSVIGRLGKSFGFLMFEDLFAFEEYLHAVDDHQAGREAAFPAHVALAFDRARDVPRALRDEIAAHGWELASKDAVPSAMAIEADLVTRPAAPREVAILEAMARALAELALEKATRAAVFGGEEVVKSYEVECSSGRVLVTIGSPYEAGALATPEDAEPFDIAASLRADDPDGEIDEGAAIDFESELVGRFARSPEGSVFDRFVRWPGAMMEYARGHLGATISEIRSRDLREVVFEIVPAKVSVDAAEAPAIVAELRAFFAYLEREHGLANAPECARVLGPGAEEKLRARLADPRNFGMAKSWFMAGRSAGFDMTTDEGRAAWLTASNARLGAPPRAMGSAPDRRAPSTAEKRAKKSERKAARKARRRNR